MRSVAVLRCRRNGSSMRAFSQWSDAVSRRGRFRVLGTGNRDESTCVAHSPIASSMTSLVIRRPARRAGGAGARHAFGRDLIRQLRRAKAVGARRHTGQAGRRRGAGYRSRRRAQKAAAGACDAALSGGGQRLRRVAAPAHLLSPGNRRRRLVLSPALSARPRVKRGPRSASTSAALRFPLSSPTECAVLASRLRTLIRSFVPPTARTPPKR
jgi:hypothetical protein